MYKKTIFKKFILVLVFLILFSFICPKQVNAGIPATIADTLYLIPRGVLRFLNWVMCDDQHEYKYDEENGGDIKVYISPESIIKGKFALLDPNIFKDIPFVTDNDNGYDSEYYDNGPKTIGNAGTHNASMEGRTKLRSTIAGWYTALRTLTIVGLLCVLVYIGIRMVLSSISQDKAKYKNMFKDWCVALCLVVFMHYIMIFTLNLSTLITSTIGTSGKNVTNGLMAKEMKIITNVINKNNEDESTGGGVTAGINYLKDKDSAECEVDGQTYKISDAFVHIIILCFIVGLTVIFLFKYLMRAITIIFLVILAPITCITYPIDKVGDRKVSSI